MTPLGILYAVGMLIVVFGLYRIREKQTAAEKAREAAESASRYKSQFLAMLSHEIRTPMNGVIGMSSLLMESGLDKQQRELAETVKQSGEALLGILNDILDFSKIEAGKLSIEAREFDLLQLVESTSGLMAPKAQSGGIELASLVHSDVPRLLIGDALRVRQICLNFLANALKFTSKGSVLLEVRSKLLEPGLVEVTIEVVDTGTGIDPETLEGLFKPFEQRFASTSQKFEASDLGLAISARLAQLMGGKVGMESRVGAGTKVWTTLPFRIQPSQAGAPASPSAPWAPPQQAIALDQTGVVFKALRHYLLPLGIELREAASKSQIKDFMGEPEESDRRRWVFINDPGGEKAAMIFCRELISRSLKSETKIVLLTGMAYRADGIDLQRAGISAALRKPLRSEAIRELVESLRKAPSSVFLSEDPLRSPHGELPTQTPFFENSRQLKILVADGDQLNVTVLVRMLDKLGFGAEIAREGNQVMELVEKSRFDIIFLDCQIQDADIRELTRKIRDLEAHPKSLDDIRDRCHIIAVSAETGSDEKEKHLTAGMDDFLLKPIQFLTLQNTLGRHLQSVTSLRRKHRPVEADKSSAPTTTDTTQFLKSASSDGNLINRETLRQIRSFGESGGADPLKEYLELFSKHSLGEFGRLRQAIQARDLNRILESVHAMKGNAANIGATSLHFRFVAIEESAGLRDWHDLETRVAAAELDFSRSVRALEHELEGQVK